MIPIFKPGDPKEASNYRLISLLSLPCKILEHIVHNEVVEFLTSNNLLSSLQFGFRRVVLPKRPSYMPPLTTGTALTLENRSSVAAVFFDLSKAFDKVPHHWP